MSLLPQSSDGTPRVTRTTHAMLVPWGLFARRIGLVRRLEQVPIRQHKRDHKPQTKLIEFLAAILAGCAYLQDISQGPQPLDLDQTVAEAWGQESWADYSGVSRTLRACTAETVAAVRQAIAAVSTPFIDAEVTLALQQEGRLFYDGDLTGRPVSSTSTTYPGAAFGWMDDAVQLGYQAALVSVRSPTYGRHWLSVALLPGNTVSCTQAEALVRAAESRTGVRPRRRTELVARRVNQQWQTVYQERQRLVQCQERVQQARQQVAAAAQAWRHWQQEVARWTDPERPRPRRPGPWGRATQARRKGQIWWRRLHRRGNQLQQARQAHKHQAQQVQQQQTALEELERYSVRLQADNLAPGATITAAFRLDAGFGSGSNLALLIELGYDVYGKALNDQVTRALRRRVTPETPWIPVGDNAEMTAWAGLLLDFCPYPLDVGLEHFFTGAKERFATLVHYGSEPVAQDLPGWFACYNGRQTIEAGVKEGKHVFQLHHLKVRSEAGLAIQEEFAVLAANLVRWAAQWLHEQCPEAQAPFNRPPAAVKRLVRVAANTSAWVYWQPEGHLLLKFDELSPFAGVELRIGPAGAAFQLPLPWFKSVNFEPF